jgi:hypothetical protein
MFFYNAPKDQQNLGSKHVYFLLAVSNLMVFYNAPKRQQNSELYICVFSIGPG